VIEASITRPRKKWRRASKITVMLRYALIIAVAAALAPSAQPTATIQKPKALTVAGGRCQMKADGTLGVNIGSNPAMPTLAFTIGPGAFMALLIDV
jgi:hypothetical protein